MKADTLKKAIQEAERFIVAANLVPITDSVYGADDWMVIHGHKKAGDRRDPCIESGRASGAARRASMDLSRCLSDLRANR